MAFKATLQPQREKQRIFVAFNAVQNNDTMSHSSRPLAIDDCSRRGYRTHVERGKNRAKRRRRLQAACAGDCWGSPQSVQIDAQSLSEFDAHGTKHGILCENLCHAGKLLLLARVRRHSRCGDAPETSSTSTTRRRRQRRRGR